MPENYTPAAAATGTWTEEEIRHQPRAWIRSLTNIDALRSALNNFLEPLLRKENLRVILTGAGTSAFIGDIIAPWLASHTGKNFSAVPTTDLVTNPMDYLNPAHPLLLISFGRSGNSPKASPPWNWQINLYPSAITCRSPATKRALFTKTRSTATTRLPC